MKRVGLIYAPRAGSGACGLPGEGGIPAVRPRGGPVIAGVECRTGHRGFTLVELLAVLAIMGVLAAIILPAFDSLTRSTQVTAAAQMAVDHLNSARQTALARNRMVEVRFYSTPAAGDASLQYRAFRSMLLDERGQNPQPLGNVQRLPQATIFSSNTNFSRFDLMPGDGSTETLPGIGSMAYRYVRFRPDGSADLASTNKWFWSLSAQRAKAVAGALPPNFATLQLDPVTGRVRLYRP